MTTHQHARHLHAHDAHGDGDHESIHDHDAVMAIAIMAATPTRICWRWKMRSRASSPTLPPLDAVELPALECLGLALAEDISSPLNLPPLANSAMDGYAVQYGDIAAADAAPPTLAVISAVAAGQVSDRAVTAGAAIRIMTGAPVPAGADTVVPFEETDELDRRRNGQPLDEITIRKALPRGSNVRPAGEDVAAGALVLPAGTVIRPAEAA